MRHFEGCAAAIVLLMVALGCEQTTVEGTGGRKLTLLQPFQQTMRRGETNEITITVGRTNFVAPIEVKFSDLPRGVEVVENEKIPADQDVGIYTLHAEPDADLVTHHVVKVTVEGPEGMTATETFEITVRDRTN